MVVYNFNNNVMINVKWYSNKINKLKEKRGKSKVLGIPVVVLDLRVNKSSEYVSIAEAARFLDTYPNAILRKIQNKQLYKERYFIWAKYNNKNNIIYSDILIKLYYIIYTKYLSILLKLKDNYKLICYTILFLLLGIIVYKLIIYIT